MTTNTLKQVTILLICAIGLYLSGTNLIAISGIKSLSDAATVMTFFSCFFPFSILSVNLSINLIQFLSKIKTLQF
jgi:hypothetical protein